MTRKDLVILVEGKDDVETINTLLSQRASAFKIRSLQFDIFPHPQAGSGCFRDCHHFLSIYCETHQHAIVILDQDAGGKIIDRDEIEAHIQKNLSENGWESRCAAVVIEPELEAWIWSSSPHVWKTLGWENKGQELKNLLLENDFWREAEEKPHLPKEALDFSLRKARIPRSSSIYAELASKVSLSRCTDMSFDRFKKVLQNWFGEDQDQFG